ncbi:hypothetical protein FNU79_06555 [Deinococcus detaillensis]|uniref:Uncharacterized protein n=1 Tax=Deinococcus detaillensis TaxID=2592048 RepID=A0A553V3N9_9DEIO|nr:hypothetical protein [Deinococcus detaillensis]TSA86841.1 hypothetical protein FNU79_06555 [Deinococcus detaillensis]
MPTVYPFEVLLDREGELTPVSLPEVQLQRQQIIKALEHLPRGAYWDQMYRTDFVSAGMPEERLITREDVEKIPVPPRRRILGELAVWPAGNHQDEPGEIKVEGAENTWVKIRSRQHAFENQTWQQFSEPEDPAEMLGYLFQHPALQLEGDGVGRYSAEQSSDGSITWTPQPPEDLKNALTTFVQRWHGETPEEWAEIHAERLEQGPDEVQTGEAQTPSALKSGFELRQPAPLRSFFAPPFDFVGPFEAYPLAEEQAYSLDGGQTWQDYPVNEPEDDDGEFGDFTDVDTFTATIWADGRMDWPKDALDASLAPRLSADLQKYTGADDPQNWKSYTEGVLKSFYEIEDENQDLPQVQAIKINVPNDLYEDEDSSDSFEAQVIEDEISFDGETWHDLYEDLPDELMSASEEQ